MKAFFVGLVLRMAPLMLAGLLFVAIPAQAQSNAPVGTVVTIEATATDSGPNASGVKGVTFFANGTPLAAQDTSAPYSFQWDTAALTPGSYTLTAEAEDNAGNVGVSPPVAFTLDAPPDTEPPTVTITITISIE